MKKSTGRLTAIGVLFAVLILTVTLANTTILASEGRVSLQMQVDLFLERIEMHNSQARGGDSPIIAWDLPDLSTGEGDFAIGFRWADDESVFENYYLGIVNDIKEHTGIDPNRIRALEMKFDFSDMPWFIVN